ncbi:MAG: acetyl esterase [Pseudonocardiales bacterium]|nr:acetyl esterase [Pseudonocardiales bacterium]
MAIPRRAAALWRVMSILDRAPLAELTHKQVRAASNLRKRLVGLPGAWLVLGRPDRGARAEDSTARLPDGTVLPLRIYRPRVAGEEPLPVVVNFHGGGWVSGDPMQSEWWCSSVSAQAGVVVVSVDYRLAPEHPFPTAAEDSYAATLWVTEHADELRVDGSRVAVMGDSAGGNLSAVVSLMARDRGTPQIALQVLIYPSVELIETFPSEDENEFAPILGKADLTAFSALYRGADDGTDPYGSPLRGKHHDLPPALIQTAEHDPLRDHGTVYAVALRSAGVEVRLTNYVDAVHGYISLPGVVPAARQALAEAVVALRDALSIAVFP